MFPGIQNGVTDITEALIGYDGLSMAIARANDFAWDLTLTEVYLALGQKVPVNGEWADNPFTMWNEINPDLPAIPILIYGPLPTSGTRDYPCRDQVNLARADLRDAGTVEGRGGRTL
jgi:phosphate transport system substrate-binding protein